MELEEVEIPLPCCNAGLGPFFSICLYLLFPALQTNTRKHRISTKTASPFEETITYSLLLVQFYKSTPSSGEIFN